MDVIRLQQVFDHYTEKFDTFNNTEHRETWKWSAVSHFQKYWDTDVQDFGEMFKTSFEDSINQIDVPSFQPIGGVIFLCKQGEKTREKVRAAFKKLLENDKSDLKKRQKRVEKFVADMNKMLQDVAPEKWKYHQDISSAILFLNFADPDDNYMYAETECKAFAEYVGVKKEMFKNDILQLPQYYKICDAIIADLQQQTDLLQLVDEALAVEADNTDDSSVTEIDGENHILVYDLIYCAQNYHLYEDAPLSGKNQKKGGATDEENEKEEKRVKAEIRALTKKKEAETEERAAIEFPKLKGKTVTHAKYGKGKITEQEDKYLTVTFPKKQIKKFILPEALTKGFLTVTGDEGLEACRAIAALDESIVSTQREIEILNIQLNGYRESL